MWKVNDIHGELWGWSRSHRYIGKPKQYALYPAVLEKLKGKQP